MHKKLRNDTFLPSFWCVFYAEKLHFVNMFNVQRSNMRDHSRNFSTPS